jgi:hypothetical protein
MELQVTEVGWGLNRTRTLYRIIILSIVGKKIVMWGIKWNIFNPCEKNIMNATVKVKLGV